MKILLLHKIIFISVIAALVTCGQDVRVQRNPDTLYPETDLKGWELDESNTGLRGDYSALTDLTDVGAIGYLGGPDGPFYVTMPVVLANKTIPYEMVIEARGVMINGCLIRPEYVGMGMPLVSAGSAEIRDSEIDGGLIPDENIVYSIACSGTGIIERCNIHHAASGISINNTTSRVSVAQGNYIHDLRWISPAHMDGITTRGSDGAGVIIRNNRSICGSASGSTGALFTQPYNGFIDRVCIKGNLLEGYGYNLYIDNHGAGYGSALFIVNNRMNPSGWGAFALDPAGSVRIAEFRENYIYDAGAEDGKGALISF
jgi:hypothetical protein